MYPRQKAQPAAALFPGDHCPLFFGRISLLLSCLTIRFISGQQQKSAGIIPRFFAAAAALELNPLVTF
jgi:hypothetical protein